MIPVSLKSVITLVSLSGANVKTLSKWKSWELEDRTDSTNRLTVNIPLSDGIGVVTDQELLFRGRRFIITSLSRSKSDKRLQIESDEAQIELNDNNLDFYDMDGEPLASAVEKALKGSRWTVGHVMETDMVISSRMEDTNANEVLKFLEQQSNGVLEYDSARRVVSLRERVSETPNVTFRYGKNLSELIKTDDEPVEATVIRPTGKEGMTISSVNGGLDYVEDFSWYIAQGLTIDEARERFTKKQSWPDERYIYNINLKRAAERRLSALAHPKIGYSLETYGSNAENLSLHEHVFVVDEELGLRLKAEVTRLFISNDPSNNQVDLAYLPESLGSNSSASSSSNGGSSESGEAVFLVKNQDVELIQPYDRTILSSSITVFTETNFTISYNLTFEVLEAGLIEGYFRLGDRILDHKIMKNVQPGWNMINATFLETQITEGVKKLDLLLKSSGQLSIPELHASMNVATRGAIGSSRNQSPDTTVENTSSVKEFTGVFSATASVSFMNNKQVSTSTTGSISDFRGDFNDTTDTTKGQP